MSYKVSQENTSKRGKEILEHLDAVNFEPWLSKIRRTKKGEKSKFRICPYCILQLERSYLELQCNQIRDRYLVGVA